MDPQITNAIIVSVLTGAISTFATVASLRVHIAYLKESIKRQGEEIDLLRSLVMRGAGHG